MRRFFLGRVDWWNQKSNFQNSDESNQNSYNLLLMIGLGSSAYIESF